MEAPHAQAPHMTAPHAAMSHTQAPHAQAPHAAMSHTQAPNSQAPHAGEVSHGNSANQPGTSHAPNQHFPEANNRISGMQAPGTSHEAGAIKPAQGAANYEHMAPQQRNAFMSKMSAPERAQTITHMNGEHSAEAMYKMTPSQRAETLNRLNPEQRKSFMSPREAGIQTGRNGMGEQKGNMIRAGAGALAAAGAGAAMMNHGGGSGPGRAIEQRGANIGAEQERSMGQHGANMGGRASNELRAVGAAPSYANPRRAQGGGNQGFQHAASQLRYAENVQNSPRAGDIRSGRAGAVDPGGYIRESRANGNFVTPAYARAQFAASMPNYSAMAAANYQNVVANRGAWPWQLPAYSPAWFNNGGGNNNWWQDGGGGWDNGPSCFNGWGGSLPWWATMANLMPWGMNSNMGWVPYQDYYNGYSIDGQTYGDKYFAPNGYCPTNYIFNVATGQFLVPGHGYVDYLPQGYTAPITVSVQESVPNYNFQGQVVGYKIQTFYYNGYWNQQNEAYGYYDYRQQYHWLTFPWLNSWSDNPQTDNQQY
jgi:hypothetical protein